MQTLNYIGAVCGVAVFVLQLHGANAEIRGWHLLKSPRAALGTLGTILIAGGALGVGYSMLTDDRRDWVTLLLLGMTARALYLYWTRKIGEVVA